MKRCATSVMYNETTQGSRYTGAVQAPATIGDPHLFCVLDLETHEHSSPPNGSNGRTTSYILSDQVPEPPQRHFIPRKSQMPQWLALLMSRGMLH